MMTIKKYTKLAIALILAVTLLSSLLLGIGLGFKSGISTGGADYVVFEGVASKDYYDGRQYSYDVNTWAYANIPSYPTVNPSQWYFNANKSLRIGMTEYGEFATPAYAGIAYGYNSTEWTNTESWASTIIPQKYWVQGWVFYINYSRLIVPGQPFTYRCVEAYALYSDGSTAEAGRKVYSWDGAYAPGTVGSDLTTGSVSTTLITSGVQILYDSARLAVGRTSTVIHDPKYDEDVAQLTLTVIFNKDTKYAIIYKDIKMLIPYKVFANINDFAFSERYELDLASVINPSNQAYIHYFANNITSVYQHPLTGSTKADVLQAFNPLRNYTYFASYWPNATEYSVWAALVPDLPHNYTTVLDPGTAVADVPAPISEPSATPEVCVQWRYNHNTWPNMLDFLTKDTNREIRFVEVAGMTDYNKEAAGFRALDIDAGDLYNNIDTEILYMLNNVFNPEDLRSTVYNQPFFMWTAVGQTAQSADNLGAVQLQGIKSNGTYYPWIDYTSASVVPLGLLDKNDSLNKGSIPFGLSNIGNFVNYLETFSNSGKGSGTDTTSYVRTGLNGFAFIYDAYNAARSPNQPIAGGMSLLPGFWYPSKDPLTQRWTATSSSFSGISANDGGVYHVNGILSVGGPKANWVSRYFNDFNFAIDREGTSSCALVNGGTVNASAPTSNPSLGTIDFFPLSTWKTSTGVSYSNAADNTAGYAVISVARDVNGTRGLSVYGWDARDTYWACAWAGQILMGNQTMIHSFFPAGTVSIILKIGYVGGDREPVSSATQFTVVKALGTITEFGSNIFATAAYGYDLITGPTSWTGSVATSISYIGGNWWFGKIPTTSTASVDFDP